MGRYDNILIVSDIDNTFLAHGGVKIPERNLKAIEYFKQEGGRFTFSTGRAIETLIASIPNAKNIANAPAIMANGAYFYDFEAERSFGDKFLDPHMAFELGKFVYNYSEDFGMRFSMPGGIVYGRLPKPPYGAYELSVHKNPTVQTPEQWDTSHCYKLVVRGCCEGLDTMRTDIEKRFDDSFDYVKSDTSFLEILPRDCSKGNALRELVSHYNEQGIALKSYACGDYENDLSMLLAADVAVCPSNACESVKKVCHMELCSCDDGVIADLIERL